MKVQEKIPTVYLEEYDIEVNKYLTYAQIQNIVNATNALLREEKKDQDGKLMRDANGRIQHYDSWSVRQQNIDMLVLSHATNLTDKELLAPHSMFLQNGIIDAVNSHIENYWQLAQAFEYTDGIKATILNIISGLTDLVKLIDPKTIIKKDK